MELDELLRAPTQSREVVRGRIANSPGAFDDDLFVTIQSFDGDRVQWGPCSWSPSSALPVRGDDCLVLFDEREQPWVMTLAPVESGVAILTAELTFSTSVVAPPGNNQLRLNNANQALATLLWTTNDSVDGIDITMPLSHIRLGTSLYVQTTADATKWQRYNATGNSINKGAYTEIPIVWVEGGAALSSARCVIAARQSPSAGPIGPVASTSLVGTYLLRPQANTVPPTTTYFATDTLGTWRSDGTAWLLTSQRAPEITSAQMSAAPYTTPYDAQEIVLVDSLTAPTYTWRLRYNASSVARDKWEFVGGAEWLVTVEGADTATWAGYADLPNGPLLTIPRTGIYNVRVGATVGHSVAGGVCYLAITGSALDSYANAPNVNYNMTMGRAGVWNVAAGTVARPQVAVSAGTGTYQKRHLSVVPARLS
jgi:hypothetical protein